MMFGALLIGGSKRANHYEYEQNVNDGITIMNSDGTLADFNVNHENVGPLLEHASNFPKRKFEEIADASNYLGLEEEINTNELIEEKIEVEIEIERKD